VCISLFDKIDSITDPARPRLSRREKMAALLGCGGGCGFTVIANLATIQPHVGVTICGGVAIILLSLYGLLFIVPIETDEDAKSKEPKQILTTT